MRCFRETQSNRICPECRACFALDRLIVAGDYGNPILPRLIRQYKYRFSADIAAILGRLLALRLRDELNLADLGASPPIDIRHALFIPVPLHPRRRRWRGFNQAEKISLSLAQYLPIEIDSEHLERNRYTRPQAKLSADERRKNLSGCFTWKGAWLDGRDIILVDDVASTASTLDECARVLKQSGAGAVSGLAVAAN